MEYIAVSNNKTSYRAWQRITAFITLVFFTFQIPTVAFAQSLLNSDIQAHFNTNSLFESVSDSDVLFSPAPYLGDVDNSFFDIDDFYSLLEKQYPAGLGKESYIPISVGDITTFIKIYPVSQLKKVGSSFVQSRYVREQVQDILGRTLIDSNKYPTEHAQIRQLYQNALKFSKVSNKKFGALLSFSRDGSGESTAPYDMLWPELRVINEEQVLVPVLYLTQATVLAQSVQGNTTEFGSSITNFNSIHVSNTDIKLGRDSFIQVLKDLTLNNGSIVSEGDLKITAGGTLQLLSSQIDANGNLNIAAHGVEARTLVHRYDLGHTRGTKYDVITDISSDGDMVIRSFRDISIHGSNVYAGGSMRLAADGSIYVGGVEYRTHERTRNGRWKGTKDSVDYLQSTITAEDTIELIANSEIVIDAADLISKEGHLRLLANMGITIENEFSSTKVNKKYKKGKKKKTVSAYQTVAIRAALDAGKGVTIHSENGDVTLRATEISSSEGAEATAKNGKVSLLMAKELDHYSYHAVSKRMFSTRTVTKGHNIERPAYPTIIGGFQANALYGLTIELEDDRNLDLQGQIDRLEKLPGMEWLTQVRDRSDIDWQEVELAYETWKTDDTSLNAAAIALISIVVAAALGPGGFAAVMSGSSMVAAAVNAGIAAVVTQATISVGNGNSLGETLEGLAEEESLKSVAISMITAAAMSGISDLDIFKGTPIIENGVNVGEKLSFLQQSGVVLANSAASAGISTVINGGSLEEFGDSFQMTLMHSAISAIGEGLAKEIGVAAGSNPPKIGKATQLIAHAAVGCLTGGATASLQESDVDTGCVSGAGGAVIGEVVAETYKDTLKSDLDAYITQNGPVDKQAAYNLIVKWSKAGVDIARLTAALTAFAVGADINIAADSAANAAENNAYGRLISALITWGYVAITGNGDVLLGLERVADREDLVRKGVDEISEGLFQFASTKAPEQTEAVIKILSFGNDALAEGVRVTFVACDFSLGGFCTSFKSYSEALWSEIPEDHRKQIEGALAVINVPSIKLDAIRNIQERVHIDPEFADNYGNPNSHVWGRTDLDKKQIVEMGGAVPADDFDKIREIYHSDVKNPTISDDRLREYVNGDIDYKYDPLTKHFSAVTDKDFHYQAKKVHLEDLDLDFNDLKTPGPDGKTKDEIIQMRKSALANRDQFDRNVDHKEWVAANADVIEASRLAGELAQEALAKKYGATKLDFEIPGNGQSGQFDGIYEYYDEAGNYRILVPEAKGGSSPLGGRIALDGKRAQQGTSAYFDSIVENMQKAVLNAENSADVAGLKNTIRVLQENKDNIDYVLVQQKFDRNHNFVNTKLSKLEDRGENG